jgi:putative sigma-54 modulation protein
MENLLSTQTSPFADRLILRGVHVTLTDALRDNIRSKVERIFRHEGKIVRIRIDIELDKTRGVSQHFIAKGHIEIGGPDLIASVSSEDAYKSLDLLMDKLDELVRRRADTLQSKRRNPKATLDTVAGE